MKSTNKAFTLIELLAVILILGIIALIAIPAVSGIVKESKDSAAKASAENYVNAAETAVMKKNLVSTFNPTTCDVSKTTLSCDGYSPIEVDIKGDLPEFGTVTFKNNSVDEYSLTYPNGKTITKSSDGTITSDTSSGKKYKVYANGTPVFFDVTTGKKCTNYTESQSATGVKSGCMKFYAFNDSKDSETVNLLLDHNTKDYVAWNTNVGWANDNEQGPLTLLEQLHADTDSWNGTVIPKPNTYGYTNTVGKIYDSSSAVVGTGYSYNLDYSGYKARLISVEEVAKITGFDYQNNSNNLNWEYFYFDTNTSSNNSSINAKGLSKYNWLFDRTINCESYGCANNDSNAFGYWTSSAFSVESRFFCAVYRAGGVDAMMGRYGFNGLRPVITVLKSKLS